MVQLKKHMLTITLNRTHLYINKIYSLMHEHRNYKYDINGGIVVFYNHWSTTKMYISSFSRITLQTLKSSNNRIIDKTDIQLISRHKQMRKNIDKRKMYRQS